MGIIYKLKPGVKDFILEQKRLNPLLSCRGLCLLVDNKFQFKLSKSSINLIIKEAGLSAPVGRRPKRKRRRRVTAPKLLEFKSVVPLLEVRVQAPAEPQPAEPEAAQAKTTPVEEKPPARPETPSESECTGAILLKATDYLIKGSYNITGAIKNRLNTLEEDLLTKIESLIYLPLFEKEVTKLWALVENEISLEGALSYLNELQTFSTIVSNIQRIISNSLQEVRCIKVNWLDGNSFYLDGQISTVWSTPYLPYIFSSTIYNIKTYINKYFFRNEPFILFTAPGYDIPTKEFFNFILSLDSKEKTIEKVILYGNRLEELEVIPLQQARRHFFVFGFWPWQFVEYRKINSIGQFKPVYVEALQRDFYAANIEIELSQPITKQSVTLKGCALKATQAEKTRLIILSNISYDVIKPEDLAGIYLTHWPNLEESFQDFSRKIELFTYTAASQRFFSSENLNLNEESAPQLKVLFNKYLKGLDMYIRWHFLPLGYEDSDFTTINERFYSLKVRLKKEKRALLATFLLPSGYLYQRELEYLCRRLNEREITDSEGRRLWLGIFS